jgi:serine protease
MTKTLDITRRRPLRQAGFLTAALGLTLGGCSVGSVDVDTNDADMTWDEFLASTYQEPWDGGLFVLNGDEVIVDEKKLEEYYQAVHGGGDALIVNTAFGQDTVWNAQQRNNLTYCVSDEFAARKPDTIAAMATATAAWEAAADVKFVYLAAEDANCNANNPNVIFDVNPVTNQPYLARAFFPNQNRDTRNVLIDLSAFGNLGAITLPGILKHELGHTLGFRHEHTRPESGATQCFEDNNWRELTPYDQLSVMHYPQCNGVAGRDLDLTTTDVEGAKTLYGAPNGANDPTDPTDPNTDPPVIGTPQSGSATAQVAAGQQVNFEGVPVLGGTVFNASITGQGDADLYVRFDQQPTLFAFDCRPYLIGSFETCALDVPAGASQAFVMIDGYTNASFELQATWIQP